MSQLTKVILNDQARPLTKKYYEIVSLREGEHFYVSIGEVQATREIGGRVSRVIWTSYRHPEDGSDEVQQTVLVDAWVQPRDVVPLVEEGWSPLK